MLQGELQKRDSKVVILLFRICIKTCVFLHRKEHVKMIHCTKRELKNTRVKQKPKTSKAKKSKLGKKEPKPNSMTTKLAKKKYRGSIWRRSIFRKTRESLVL